MSDRGFSKTASYGLALLGTGLAFWLPDVAVHAAYREAFGAAAVLLLTALLPALAGAFFSVFVFALRYQRRGSGGLPVLSSSFAAVLGVWVTGPLMMTVTAAFSGGGFAAPGG
jgi:presenilin-like A22 family membrane protease